MSFVDYLAEVLETHDRKNKDYGTDVDPLANIRASAGFGVPPWVGALVRLNDKIVRLQSFLRNGKLENESVRDSLLDICVYGPIALQLYDEEVDGAYTNCSCPDGVCFCGDAEHPNFACTVEQVGTTDYGGVEASHDSVQQMANGFASLRPEFQAQLLGNRYKGCDCNMTDESYWPACDANPFYHYNDCPLRKEWVENSGPTLSHSGVEDIAKVSRD